MALTGNPQNKTERQQKQPRSEFHLRPIFGVRQDRSGSHRDRTASSQAYHLTDAARADRLDKNSDRVQKQDDTRPTVQAIGWVERPVSWKSTGLPRRAGKPARIRSPPSSRRPSTRPPHPARRDALAPGAQIRR